MKKSILLLSIVSIMFAQVPDAPTVYPKGEVGKMVKLGKDIIMNTNTHPLTKEYVGNALKCTSCHLDGGKTKNLGTFIGTAAAFPAYSKREKTVQTLQDRINNCFMRSMNGVRPIVDTEASIAMTTYITWLSSGATMKMNEKKPVNEHFTKVWPNTKELTPLIKKANHENYTNGMNLYNNKCSSCHGVDGQGIATFPPVWGSNSYNTGAGLSKLDKMTTWLKHNMPLGNPNLTQQEAIDISIYVNAQERDAFDLKEHLLPREKMGYYNSKVLEEKHTVESNFKAFGLDLNKIRNDK
ncbi:MAG: c-type cytochrome [Poseidonibacter sp.]|uniref:c-type cytochrome n=1 Tax=Poseidonibacter sp. TaxID=2321188 RepID=UPI00359D32E7